jgi:hypothetical protein
MGKSGVAEVSGVAGVQKLQEFRSSEMPMARKAAVSF